MKKKAISIAGVNTLLGQLLLQRLVQIPSVTIMSLHDRLAENGSGAISQSKQWRVDPEVLEEVKHIPLLPPSAKPLATLLLSFLPEQGAGEIESKHLRDGTRLITHCEYARLIAPMVCPNVLPDPDPWASYLVTPNCTTVICASPLHCIHKAHGIESVTITTLQAISGTDLPGLQAYRIHDQVIGQVDQEACALTEELGRMFNNAFSIDVFATRVPVWQGHTITLSLTLSRNKTIAAVEETLRSVPGIRFDLGEQWTQCRWESCRGDDSIAIVTELREGQHSVLITLKGDNLGSATIGIMEQALNMLEV